MKIKSAILFADGQRRSQFEHGHRRRADRAQQVTASLRQATGSLTYIAEEDWTGAS